MGALFFDGPCAVRGLFPRKMAILSGGLDNRPGKGYDKGNFIEKR